MKSKGKRRKPPSRIKYEREHPTISVRVDPDLRARLDIVRESLGKSIRQILREAVGLQEVETQMAREDGVLQGRSAGYEEGFDEAKRKYLVAYRCRCGRPIEVTSENVKAAAGKYLEEHGWGHGDCIR